MLERTKCGSNVPDPEACIKTKCMVYAENESKTDDSSVNANPENKIWESSSEAVGENNVMLPCCLTHAWKSIKRYGLMPYI